MKKIFSILSLLALTLTVVSAQTLNVKVGDVLYQFPASQTGTMDFGTDVTSASGSSTLTILNKTFYLDDVSSMYVDETEVEDNTVGIVYDGTSAAVTVAGNIAQYITASVSGAHVVLTQSSDVSEEITYTLSGSSTDGEFSVSGSYKTTIALNGLELTNPSGAAMTISNGKRINLSVKKDTENTLTDGSGSQKACLYCKGHLEIKGKGILNVNGNYAHGIKTGEYLSIKNCTVNVLAAAKDGVSCNEYFLMESGELNISGAEDDGLQVDIDGDSSTGQTTDHEDEDSGNIYLQDGTLTVKLTNSTYASKAIKAEGDVYITGGTLTASTTSNGYYDSDAAKTKASAAVSADGNITIEDGIITVSVSGTAAKGLKADGNITVSGGTLKATTSGNGYYDSNTKKTKASSGMNADGNTYITGGTLTMTSTGAGGKGMSGDGSLEISGGTVNTSASGGILVYSGNTLYTNYTGNTDNINTNYKSSPKGMKYDGAITVSDGTISAYSAKSEGIESKSTIDITGGHVYSEASDDAINSSSHMTIDGGYVCGYSTGNDGLDANGNCIINGGVVYAIGSTDPEVGIDANTEGGYKLYVNGGTVIAIGGLERNSVLSQKCYYTSSWSKSTWYALYDDGNLVLAFKTPSAGGTKLVVTTGSESTLKSGVTVSGGTSYFNGMTYIGATVSGGSDADVNDYTATSEDDKNNQNNGNNPPGGGGGGPGGRH